MLEPLELDFVFPIIVAKVPLLFMTSESQHKWNLFCVQIQKQISSHGYQSSELLHLYRFS